MFGKIVEKIRFIKADYMKKNPRRKWQFVRDAGIKILRYSGVAFLDSKFEVYWWSYAAAVVIIDITLSFIYSVCYYSFVVKDPIKGALNLPLYFGILLPVKVCIDQMITIHMLYLYNNCFNFSSILQTVCH